MVKNLKGRDSFLFLAFGVMAVSLAVYVYGQTSINYLPRNQKIERHTGDYSAAPLVREGIACAGDPYSNQVALCNYCVLTLKPGCPDCCFYFAIPPATDRYLRGGDSDPSGCSDALKDDAHLFGFPTATYGQHQTECVCPKVERPVRPRNWHDLGMPNQDRCEPNATAQIWYCNDERYVGNSQCINLMKDSIKDDNNVKCDFGNNFFSPIRELDPDNNPADLALCTRYNLATGGNNHWWEYPASLAYRTCVATCPSRIADERACDAQDRAYKNSICAYHNCVLPGCTPPRTNGYDLFCNQQFCQQRDATPNCDDEDVNTCGALITSATDCFTGTENCGDCFRDIESSFHYDFVGKTGESITFIWQIDTEADNVCNPMPCPAMSLFPPYYFYTQIRLFDLNVSATVPVWRSVMNQKQVATAFNIYAADLVVETPDVTSPYRIPNFVAGHKYVARLFYYLPVVPDFTLRMKIKKMSINAIKVRGQ